MQSVPTFVKDVADWIGTVGGAIVLLAAGYVTVRSKVVALLFASHRVAASGPQVALVAPTHRSSTNVTSSNPTSTPLPLWSAPTSTQSLWLVILLLTTLLFVARVNRSVLYDGSSTVSSPTISVFIDNTGSTYKHLDDTLTYLDIRGHIGSTLPLAGEQIYVVKQGTATGAWFVVGQADMDDHGNWAATTTFTDTLTAREPHVFVAVVLRRGAVSIGDRIQSIDELHSRAQSSVFVLNNSTSPAVR